MRKIYIFILMSILFCMHSQRIRPFVGVSGYRDTDFNNATIGSVAAGIEIRTFDFFRPELEVGYMYGTLEPSESYHDDFVLQSITYRKVSALNYSFCPKIYFGNSRDPSSGGLIILPRYTCSQVMGSTERYSRNPDKQTNAIVVNESTTAFAHSLGIGIGVLFDVSNTYNHVMAINLYFNGVNLGSALKKLDESSTLNTNDTLGLGLNMYFGGKKKL